MGELISEISTCLVIAGILGFLIGYFMGKGNCDKVKGDES